MNVESKADALFSLCRALLGEIPFNLRAAAIKIENSVIWTYFFFQGEFSEDDWEDMSCVNTEVISDFPSVDTEIVVRRLDYPNPLPEVGLYAFSRDTPMPKSVLQHEIRDCPLLANAILSICQALLGKVSPHLRGVGMKEIEGGLKVFFFLDKGAKSADFALTEQAAREVVADFPELSVDVDIQYRPFPDVMTSFLDRWAFLRKEPPIK